MSHTEVVAVSPPTSEVVSKSRVCIVCGSKLANINPTSSCFRHGPEVVVQAKGRPAWKWIPPRQVMPKEGDVSPACTFSKPARVKKEILVKDVKSIRKIIELVCEHFDIPETGLRVRCKRTYLRPRQLLMYLLYKDTPLIEMNIGTLVAVTNHTTVSYAVKKIHKQLEEDVLLQSVVATLRSKY